MKCPLCGREARFVLDKDELRAYMRTNPRFAICSISDRDDEQDYHTVHTDSDEEWLTPPDYVKERTLADIGIERPTVSNQS